ncbi:MAG: cysteine desulfurase [Deltaproteobacteria bacterium]|nr:cysteine desulfurase [Deltaproteobacteria bacterium]
MIKPIYVDANGTYPIKPAHYDAVAAALKSVDGNPSSIHAPGRNAKIALEDARTAVARLLGATANEIIFTSGATEANNFALSGSLRAGLADMKPLGEAPRIVVTATEHAAVIETAKALSERGLCELQIAPVSTSGQIDLNALESLITPNTALVSYLAANNETGVVQATADVARRIRSLNNKVHIHVDAVQLLGKSDLSWLASSDIDSAAFSAHKIGSYKGVGALYLRRGKKLTPLVTGGGQERGRRAGTENMPGIVSFGIRARELLSELPLMIANMTAARDALLQELKSVPDAVIHGLNSERLPNTVNFHIDGVAGDDILLNLDIASIYASSGSACSSSVARPSHVLTAMGYSDWVALNSVRVSFTGDAAVSEVGAIIRIIHEVRQRSITHK